MRRRLARTRPSNSRIHQATKEALVDKVKNVVVSNRVAVSPGALVTGQFGRSSNTEHTMKAQALGDSSSYTTSKKTQDEPQQYDR